MQMAQRWGCATAALGTGEGDAGGRRWGGSGRVYGGRGCRVGMLCHVPAHSSSERNACHTHTQHTNTHEGRHLNTLTSKMNLYLDVMILCVKVVLIRLSPGLLECAKGKGCLLKRG